MMPLQVRDANGALSSVDARLDRLVQLRRADRRAAAENEAMAAAEARLEAAREAAEAAETALARTAYAQALAAARVARKELASAKDSRLGLRHGMSAPRHDEFTRRRIEREAREALAEGAPGAAELRGELDA